MKAARVPGQLVGASTGPSGPSSSILESYMPPLCTKAMLGGDNLATMREIGVQRAVGGNKEKKACVPNYFCFGELCWH